MHLEAIFVEYCGSFGFELDDNVISSALGHASGRLPGCIQSFVFASMAWKWLIIKDSTMSKSMRLAEFKIVGSKMEVFERRGEESIQHCQKVLEVAVVGLG
jgi:hypothetical protein